MSTNYFIQVFNRVQMIFFGLRSSQLQVFNTNVLIKIIYVTFIGGAYISVADVMDALSTA